MQKEQEQIDYADEDEQCADCCIMDPFYGQKKADIEQGSKQQKTRRPPATMRLDFQERRRLQSVFPIHHPGEFVCLAWSHLSRCRVAKFCGIHRALNRTRSLSRSEGIFGGLMHAT